MTTRRRLFTALLVATMLVGTLAMPASAAAAGSPWTHATAHSGPFDALYQFLSNLLGLFDRDERVAEGSVWVRPGVDATLRVGQVTLHVPGSATRQMREGFRLTMAVRRVRDGVVVDLQPDGTVFSGRGVLLSFGRDVESAVDEAGQALKLAPRGHWLGNDPTFWVEHFSRYSGWF